MPRLEEIDDADDIDNLEMELAELDPSLKTPVAPRIVPEITRSQDLETSLFPNMPQFDLQNQPTTTNQPAVAKFTKEELEELKGFQLLYPCYFDKDRSQGQGRRVPIDCAVENPLAKTIADAIHSMGLLCVFEGEKCHPQDFGNPGRVRVLLKDEGKPTKPSTFPTKRALMKKVSEYLQAHPTTLKSLNEVPYGPDFEGFVPRVIPKVKGFVMNDIVPLHSAYSMGHPMSKSVYDEPQEIIPEKQVKMPKNKYKVVRR